MVKMPALIKLGLVVSTVYLFILATIAVFGEEAKLEQIWAAGCGFGFTVAILWMWENRFPKGGQDG